MRTRMMAMTATVALSCTLMFSGAPAFAETDTSRWDAAAQQLFSDPQFDGPTAVYVAVYDPQTGWTRHAMGESASGVPATLDDYVPIGSITKTAFATAVLEEVEKGTLSLDDTVRELDPQLAKKFPKTAKWTVRQLLSMTTQIPDYADPSLDKLIADPKRKFAREELISIGINEGEALPKEGGYSTTNYIVLGEIMRKLTGKSPAKLVNAVFDEAGMDDSYLGALGTRPAPATHGYVGNTFGAHTETINPAVTATTDTNTQDGNWYMTWGREGGGAYATTEDLGTWAKSCVGNSLLKKATVKEREKTNEINAGDYGLGIIKEGDWWGHSGQVLGYEALAVCNPKTGQAVAVGVNSSSSLVPAIATLGQVAFPEYLQAWVEANLIS